MRTFLVFAKAPPGYAKTRLSPASSPREAAATAAAAAPDTVDVLNDAATSRPILSLAGSLDDALCWQQIRLAVRSWAVVPHAGRTFARRLVHAHTYAASRGAHVVKIGMDTPQVTPPGLRQAAALDATDVSIGPTADGGWWLLGLRHGVGAETLTGVPVSTAHTGRATAAASQNHGLRMVAAEEFLDIAGTGVPLRPTHRSTAPHRAGGLR